MESEDVSIITKVCIRPDSKIPFIDWQASLHAAISEFPGFVSLAISGSEKRDISQWTIVERFSKGKYINEWRVSGVRIKLFEELKPMLNFESGHGMEEVDADSFNKQGFVTEVFVTEVSPDKISAYKKWIAKIHWVEAKFPGFRGVYVQSPMQGSGKNWVTFLQFDNTENLDRWLTSSERKEVLAESQNFIRSLESHRVISPYAGWFSSISKDPLTAPPAWKQAMIVLLVLFPLVMLEMIFLSPLIAGLNKSLGTFIGNVISVGLVTWPTVPMAIWCLGWWLSPSPEKAKWATTVGTFLVLLLYAIEVVVFWHFVK